MALLPFVKSYLLLSITVLTNYQLLITSPLNFSGKLNHIIRTTYLYIQTKTPAIIYAHTYTYFFTMTTTTYHDVVE